MKTLATLALLVAMSTVALAEEGKYQLQYKFAPGDVLRSKVVHLSTVETKIKGSTQTAQSRSISTKRWQIEKVDAQGLATFQHSVENINMWQKVTDRPEQRYNSETDAQPPAIYVEAAKSVGVPLSQITVDPQGRLVNYKHLAGSPSGESQILPILPKDPVAIGAAWYSPDDLIVRAGNGAQKHIKTRQVFRLVSVAGDIATISTETQILTPIDDPMLKVELIQKLTRGQVKFDIAAGRLISQQLDLDETIIGFQGETSVMNYLGRMTEEMLPGEKGQVAAKPAPAAPQPAKVATMPAPPIPPMVTVTDEKPEEKEPAKLANRPTAPRKLKGVPTPADPSTKPVEEEAAKDDGPSLQ